MEIVVVCRMVTNVDEMIQNEVEQAWERNELCKETGTKMEAPLAKSKLTKHEGV